MIAEQLPDRLRRWHRTASLILVAQWLLWVLTALGMALVPRAWTTAYAVPADMVTTRAETIGADRLRSLLTAENRRRESVSLPPVSHARLAAPGNRPLLGVRSGEDGATTYLAVDTGEPAPMASREHVLAEARRLTGESIADEALTLTTKNSPEYQKQPLPVWRVQASRAVVFFEPVTSAYVGQATFWKWWENLLKTLHTLDPTGNAEFRQNIQLTVAAVLFLAVSVVGTLSVRRLLILRRGARTVESWSYRWHQTLGLLIVIQVVLQATSGLSVVWLLEHPTVRGSAHVHDASEPIAIDRVVADPPAGADAVTLTMVLGEPVYRVETRGRTLTQELRSASSGEPRTITEADRDQLAQRTLVSSASLMRWELGTRIDEHFFAGPFPAWKGFYAEPNPGTLAIDATTGRVHLAPRTERFLFIEDYYKMHVASYDMNGVIRYRLEPTTLTLIALMGTMMISGLILQVARLRRGKL